MLIKRRLLFLYTVPGTGHQKASDAMMAAIGTMNPRIECVGVEAARYAYSVFGDVFNRMYLQMVERAPAIWDYLYDNPDVEEFTRDARNLLTKMTSFRTQQILKTYRPEAVICTQAIPVTSMAAEKRKGRMKIPLIGVITDFGVHGYWYHQEVDLYLVAHEDTRQEMMKRGIKPEKIKVTGIPIHPKFGETDDQVALRLRLKISPHKKTILLMGGSHGLGSLEKIVETLKIIPLPFQTMVVCGRNKSLHRRITKACRGESDFHVMGYSKDLASLMGAADFLITKPGGLTISEALAKRLPMILTNPIPGQEERNVEFLAKYHVAALARTMEDLSHIATDWLRHPKKLTHLQQRARRLSRPYSAWEAARNVFSLIGGKSGSNK